jgi:hypothetical protein
MGRKKKISTPNLDLRLQALDRRLEEKTLSRRQLSVLVGLKPTTAQKWFEQNRWPDRDEAKICAVCDVPPTFFADIARKISYEQALLGKTRETELERREAHEGLDEILNSNDEVLRRSILGLIQASRKKHSSQATGT